MEANRGNQTKGSKMVAYTIKALRQHETNGGVYWSCNLYRNNKKVAEVENKGDGGANWYHWFDGCREFEKELLEFAAVAVPEYQGDLDMYFELLIVAHENTLEARRNARRNAA